MAQHKKQEALQNEQYRPPSPKEEGKKLRFVTFSLDQKDGRQQFNTRIDHQGSICITVESSAIF